MFVLVLKPICVAAAAAVAMTLLFGSLFDEAHENPRWMTPGEAKAAQDQGLKDPVAQIRPPRELGDLWQRRSAVFSGEVGNLGGLLLSGREPVDRSIALALQPVDVEQELESERKTESRDFTGGAGRNARRVERQRDQEWIRVHTPPQPPQLDLNAPVDADEWAQREPGPDATVIVANAATNYEMEGRLVLFEGGVTMSGPDFSLASDRLDVHMGEEDGRPSKMVAYGDVQVRTSGQGNGGASPDSGIQASAQRATFDPLRETLLLEGWPRIRDADGSDLAASESGAVITIHTRTGKIETSGRTRSRLSIGQ